MKQQEFERRHEPEWEAMAQRLEIVSKGGLSDDFPVAYEKLCHQLALARQRRYSRALIDRLNRLVIKGHRTLHTGLPRYGDSFVHYLVRGFPRTVRANLRFLLLATSLFLLPGLIMYGLCLTTEGAVYSLMPVDQVRDFEQMYQPGQSAIGRDRESDTDLMMFCFYISHNIGIGFQTFASGVLFGVGSVYFLFYNGLYIGAATGHIHRVGFGETFFPFVVGHGAFELTAIVLMGAAGLRLGWSLLSPGPLTRLSSLRHAGKEAIVIVYGATLMLVIAAFIEAFWSSSSNVPAAIKYGTGAVFWLMVFLYFWRAGRKHET